MATDYGKLTEELSRFYDFTEKAVLFVGVGSKQLFDPAIKTRKLMAIDRDAAAVHAFERAIAATEMRGHVDAVAMPFEEVRLSGDVVYFEFCLHEMADPEKALAHARSLAPDIVVFDHSPGSEWMFYAAEEHAVIRSAEAMQRFGIRRREHHVAEQRFADHNALLDKIGAQGPAAIERAQHFKSANDIVIPMPYELNLL